MNTCIHHADRIEKLLPEIIAVCVTRDFFNNISQQEISGVIVLISVARIKIIRIVFEIIKQFFIGYRFKDIYKKTILIGKAMNTRSMRQQLVNIYFAFTLKIWKIFR